MFVHPAQVHHYLAQQSILQSTANTEDITKPHNNIKTISDAIHEGTNFDESFSHFIANL